MRLDLLWFDLTQSLPVVWRIVRTSFGWPRALIVLGGVLRSTLFTDPLHMLPTTGKETAGEKYTRAVIANTLHFETALRRNTSLDEQEVHNLLRQVVAQSGAAYIRSNLTIPSIPKWKAMSEESQRGFAEGVLERFENMEAQVVKEEGFDFGFDVHLCHFANLSRQMGREDLAPLFCEADSVYFGNPLVPVRLHREEKISVGDSRCSFRFRLEAPEVESGS